MAALTSSAGPFYAKDSAGTMQKIKVVDLPFGPGDEDDLIAGYAYIEATGSTYDYVTGSYEKLADISSSLENIDLSPLADLADKVDFITASVDTNTKYVEQILKFQRATNIYSKRYTIGDLFDISNNPNIISLQMEGELNPAVETSDRENYISKAIEVIIQNSTNKNMYVKISYDPASTISDTQYTIKIPPGVIYNSESKIAHILHKITFAPDAYSTFVGEVAVSVAYNDNLNNDYSIGQSMFGESYISTVATNYFDMEFVNPIAKYIVAEWHFESGSGPNSFNGMTVQGQARITDSSNQKLTLYISNDGGNTIYGNPEQSVEVVDETPTPWSLNFVSAGDTPATGRYELIAKLSGSGDKGDARILYADLIRRKITIP